MNNCNCNPGCGGVYLPGPTPSPVNCCNQGKTQKLRTLVIPAELGTDAEGQPYAPAPAAYKNTIVRYLANGALYIYDANGVFTKFADAETLEESIDEISANLTTETEARENADQNLQTQITELKDSTDVKDVVGTYAELEAYDTSTLGNNDIVKVLQDETHNDATTYYRWSTATSTWTYIGELGPYYTKEEVDADLAEINGQITSIQEEISGAVTRLEAI